MPSKDPAQSPGQLRTRRGAAEVEGQSRDFVAILQALDALPHPRLPFGIQSAAQVGVEVPVGFEARRMRYASSNHVSSIGQGARNLQGMLHKAPFVIALREPASPAPAASRTSPLLTL